jgi:hypothetical protein
MSSAERSLPAIVASTAVARKRTAHSTRFLPSQNSARQSNDRALMNAHFTIYHEFIIPIISTF